MESVELKPKYFLDENWKTILPIPSKPVRAWKMAPDVGFAKRKRTDKELANQLKQESMLTDIRKIRIEVAKKAETTLIKSDEKNDYLKSELGMNIILPRGKIEEMRFIVNLKGGSDNCDVSAVDGFPKDTIEEKYVLDGTVTVAVSKLFKFIPIIGDIVSDTVDVEIKPWKFKLGSLKKVNVDFSGGLTSNPEWYFKKNGIKNDVRVALTIKKPKEVKFVDADVRALWIYDPGILKKQRIGTDSQSVKIYND